MILRLLPRGVGICMDRQGARFFLSDPCWRQILPAVNRSSSWDAGENPLYSIGANARWWAEKHGKLDATKLVELVNNCVVRAGDKFIYKNDHRLRRLFPRKLTDDIINRARSDKDAQPWQGRAKSTDDELTKANTNVTKEQLQQIQQGNDGEIK